MKPWLSYSPPVFMATSAPAADDQSARLPDPTKPAAEAAAPEQPNQYGGNFSNATQPVLNDPNRGSNQRADANRGDFGAQSHQGHSHGGYGDQTRAHITEHQDEHDGATEAKYYGDGNVRPGLDAAHTDQNAYRTYDGQGARPEFQGHAVRDTPAPRPDESSPETGTDRRGNTRDTRNLPDKAGPDAAFQNDNGAPTVGAAFADDYGHTSGVGLPADAADHHVAADETGRNQHEDGRSSRGGYDNQGSGGGALGHAETAAPASGSGAPAPINAPAAPQGEGYGHERSEQAQPGPADTGEARSGFAQPAGQQPGDTSQGLGSEGGSYDDANPGAHGPEYDSLTPADKAKNYGSEAREAFRPEGNPDDKSDTAPRRNARRD